jgi:hypothetical protein
LSDIGVAPLNPKIVIAGLDPAIHQSREMDARVKPAHDENSSQQPHYKQPRNA